MTSVYFLCKHLRSYYKFVDLACGNFCACVTQKGIPICSVPHTGHLHSKTGAKGSKWWNSKGYYMVLIKSLRSSAISKIRGI